MPPPSRFASAVRFDLQSHVASYLSLPVFGFESVTKSGVMLGAEYKVYSTFPFSHDDTIGILRNNSETVATVSRFAEL
jgi:hypothetical protein